MAIRGPARATLGTAWLHVRWQAPPMTKRSPQPSEKARGTALAWAEEKAARLTERDRRHHGLRQIARGCVSMPGHAVAAIAVVGGAHPFERGRVVGVEEALDLRQDRVTGTVGGEAGDETRNVDHAIVHLAALVAPDRGAHEVVEQGLVAGHPAGEVIDPGGVVEGQPANRAQAHRIDARRAATEKAGLTLGGRGDHPLNLASAVLPSTRGDSRARPNRQTGGGRWVVTVTLGARMHAPRSR